MAFLSYQVIFLPFRLVQGLPGEVQRSRGKITLFTPVGLFLRGQPMKGVFGNLCLNSPDLSLLISQVSSCHSFLSR